MNRITLTVLLFSTLHFVGQAQTKNFIDQPYLDVTGYADSLVIPNEIYIDINISEKDSRDRVSIEEYETKMVDGLKTLGLNPEKDLTTNDLGSNYRFYLLKQKDVMKSKQYILKVTDAVTASKVFMLLEDLEISNTSIERVDHSEKENIKNITRTKAVENAKTKAISLTKPLNQTVGQAVYMTDNETTGNLLEGRAAGVIVAGYGKKRTSEKELPKIEFEKIKVSTTVSVKFILK
jgi:uncharacterized protein YggE